MHDRFFSGLRFNAAAKLVIQVASWVGSLYVLGALDAHDLGAFGIASAVLGYATIVYEGGLLEALVQRQPSGEVQRRAVFSMLLLIGLGLALLMTAAAPMVAGLVNDPVVAQLILVLAVGMLLLPVSILSQSMLMHAMRFDLLAGIGSMQAIVTTGVTVWLAHGGHGAWSLALGFVAGIAIKTLLCLWAQPPQAGFTLSIRPAARYLNTGGVLVADSLLWRWYTSVDSLLLGRWVGTEQLGNFSFGQQVSNMPLEKITTVINDISLPAYVALENNPAEARRMMLELMRTHAMIGFPMFWGLAAVAEPAVLTIFGEKWLPAVWCLTALSLIGPLRLIGSVETPAMTGIGRPRVLLKSKAIVAPTMTLALAAGAWWGGVDGVAWAWLVAFPIAYGFAFRYVLAAMGLSYGELAPIVRGPLFSAAGMALLAWGVTRQLADQAPYVQLAAGIAAGVLGFSALIWLLDREGLWMTVQRLRRLAGLAPQQDAT